jgi:hypothetical protein
MTVQELIDQLLLIEDKSKLVVNEYDGWYNEYNSLATIDLYTSDNCRNMYGTKREAEYEEKEVITKNCILIDTSDGYKILTSDLQEYFYTKTK